MREGIEWIICGSLVQYSRSRGRCSFLCGSLLAISSFIGISIVGGQSVLEKTSKDSGEIQSADFGGRKGSRQ